MFYLFAVFCISQAGQTHGISAHPAFLLKEIRQNDQPYREFAYDSLDRLISVKAYNNDYANETYAYDSLGRLFKRFYAGFEETYQYNADGALISMIKYYPATDKTWSEDYRRNSTGVIVGATEFYNGDTIGYVLYNYDDRGNTIDRSEYSKDSTLSYQERCAFDSLANPVQLSFPFDMTKKGTIVSYYYYSIIMSSPPTQYTSSYRYNESGLPVSETRVVSFSKDTLRFEYRYDKKTGVGIPTPATKETAAITLLRRGPRSPAVIALNLDCTALTSVFLVDLSGRRVALFLNPTIFPAGNHHIPLPVNGYRDMLADGAYRCIVKAGAMVKTFNLPVIRQ